MVTIAEIKKKFPKAFEDLDKETTIKTYESQKEYLKSIMEDGETMQILIWRLIIEREEYRKEAVSLRKRLQKCSKSTTEPEMDHS